ncbi:MAG: SufS family cysteine desulfurase [Flavobacteriales bacterium]|nr:SufS family cysteine desulfurase [Flavobacteriales bacterium]
MKTISAMPLLNPYQVQLGLYRDHFPLLQNARNKNAIHYLDNAATTQKPEILLQATNYFYKNLNANVHRGVYQLSQEATQAYEGARSAVARFIKARNPSEIVFTSGATESLNIIANWFGHEVLDSKSEVIVTMMEHHANLIPWQQACSLSKARMVPWIPDENGNLDLNILEKLINSKTKVIAVCHVSNVLGTINPIREICALAHQYNVTVVVDGSQAVPHFPVNMEDLDCDFYCFSAHKVFGPTGLGILYGKKEQLEKVMPFRLGGEMVEIVTFESATYKPLPARLEAGTPNFAAAYAFSVIIDFLKSITYDSIYIVEQELKAKMLEILDRIGGFRILGNAEEKVPLFALIPEKMHPHDVAQVLALQNVAVRAGYQCAMPLHRYYGAENGSLRISMAFYNNQEDLDALEEGLKKAQQMLKG